MALVRTPAETALDEVAAHCQEAAGAYRTARAATDDPDLGQLFADLAARRQAAAAAVQAEIRRMGNLPDVPDPDREALEHLATRIRAAVAADERESLLAACRRQEEELAAAIDTALAQDLPAAVLDRLHRLQTEGAAIRGRLATV